MRNLPPLPADSLKRTVAFPTTEEAKQRRRRDRMRALEALALAGITIFGVGVVLGFTRPEFGAFGVLCTVAFIVARVHRRVAP